MPMYQCCFLDETGSPVRTQALGSSDDRDAHREAMALLVRTGRFSGFELWSGDLRIEIYQPSEAKAPSETLPSWLIAGGQRPPSPIRSSSRR